MNIPDLTIVSSRQPLQAPARPFQMAVALHQAAFSATMQLDPRLRTAMMRAESRPRRSVRPSRVFRGTPDQLRIVRDYVRTGFAGHEAVEDAVLVASELATNSIEHSASGLPGGIFMVQLSALTALDVGIIVTDEGGSDKPHEKHADTESESGRGLAVVRSLSSFLAFSEDSRIQSVVAIISAQTGQLICEERQS